MLRPGRSNRRAFAGIEQLEYIFEAARGNCKKLNLIFYTLQHHIAPSAQRLHQAHKDILCFI